VYWQHVIGMVCVLAACQCVLCAGLSATGGNSAITAEIIMFLFSHVRLMLVQYSKKDQDLFLSYSFQIKIHDK